MKEEDPKLHRRQVIEAGVAGAALLVLPQACGSSGNDESDAAPDARAHDAQPDVTVKDVASPQDAADEPDATLVDGGGSCEDQQTDWTRPISIMKAGIALKGTAYAFKDPRFMDLVFDEDRILVINPLTGTGYVAMSGVCTHLGCSPEYFAQCGYNAAAGTCTASETDGGSEGGAPEGGSDAGADSSAPSDAAVDAEEDGGTTSLTDVLYCPCHGSVYNALNGVALYGPATGSGNLQTMKTCVGGGYVFVFIPDNAAASGG